MQSIVKTLIDHFFPDKVILIWSKSLGKLVLAQFNFDWVVFSDFLKFTQVTLSDPHIDSIHLYDYVLAFIKIVGQVQSFV